MVKRWISTLDDEHSCSSSITSEKMLDCVTHGHDTNENNAVSIRDALFSNLTENYNTNAMFKNESGYSSDSSKIMTHKNGLYISEEAAFGDSITSVSAQEKLHHDNVIEEEGHFQFQITVEETNENSKSSEGDYVPYTIAKIQHASSSSTSPTLTEGKQYGKGNSPAISEGEYLPYTVAINQDDSVAELTLLENNHHIQENCATGV